MPLTGAKKKCYNKKVLSVENKEKIADNKKKKINIKKS